MFHFQTFRNQLKKSENKKNSRFFLLDSYRCNFFKVHLGAIFEKLHKA